MHYLCSAFTLFTNYYMAELGNMRIKIADGATIDIGTLGFYLGKSPSELSANIKESNFVVTDFPDEDGEDVYVPSTPKTKSFDYPVTLIYVSNDINVANTVIKNFYDSLVGKLIIIYNDYKKVMVKGYAKSYKSAEFYRNEKDVIVFEIVFYIPKPQDCNFDYSTTQSYSGGGSSEDPGGGSGSITNPEEIVQLDPSAGFPITLTVPIGATRAVFAYNNDLGDVASVIYTALNIDVKDIFTYVLVPVVNELGDTVNYRSYSYTPAIPYTDEVTYIISI